MTRPQPFRSRVDLDIDMSAGAPSEVRTTCPRGNTVAPPLERPRTVLHYCRLLCPHCHWFLKWRKWPRDREGHKLPRPAHLCPHLSPWEPIP